MEQIRLYTNLQYLHLRNDLKSEVNNFVEFLLAKRKKELKNKVLDTEVSRGRSICRLILMILWKFLKHICDGITMGYSCFDLVSQCIANQLTIMTKDENIRKYNIWTIW